MQIDLEGKSVLITEANRNFGLATALAFANEGADLLLVTSEGTGPLAQVTQAASTHGARVITTSCDISDQSQAKALVQQGLAEFGHLDVVVNNVLYSLPANSLEDIPFEVMTRKLDVELTGSFYLFQKVLPGMMEQKWGRVINYTGLAGFQGTDPLSSAANLGIVGLTRGIANEYGKYNITANCLGPGGVEGEEQEGRLPYPPGERDPLPRWGKPEEVAQLAVFLCSEHAAYVTGQCILANGGKYLL